MNRLVAAIALVATSLPAVAALPLPVGCTAVIGPANAAAVPILVSGATFATCSGGAIEIRTAVATFGDWGDYTVAPGASLTVTARVSISIPSPVPPFATLTLNAPAVTIDSLSATGWHSLSVGSTMLQAVNSRIEPLPDGTLDIDGINRPAPVHFQGAQLSIIQDRVVLTAPVAAVPEPGTWAMLLAGAGFVGFVARRRLAVRRL